ncbi:ribosomal L23 family protein [[Clostridium] bifermentans ATCC 638]|uniref:Ribosomal L23 family protein n=1 Tax=Paraclostridium bifermentans ATCC 638 = DSM 14991 TaxID=1233171 RepID=T4VGC9_PARBF|nr:hypothetical protein [Paraclostridium bifermentans]EQK39821.1 ribosomal L23 family protein [[Clostridium] bifermentans ATCC 638] [Paraclostridium bifermentans ATCC 638 = DSM 14991]
MTEAEILEMTYLDRCTIKRKVKVKNEDTGVTSSELKIIAENVKCALSNKESVVSVIKEDGAGKIVSNNQLFANPNTDIKEGDTVEVTVMGELSIYLASKPFKYPSHLEVFITEKERV